MKPVPSVLKIVDFAIIRMDFEFVAGENVDGSVNPMDYFRDYELDLDFSGGEGKYFQVTMSVDINNGSKPLPGYKISATVATLFQFGDTSSISADERNSMEGFSTVYMALNNLRGIISGFTANAPYGRYTLPSIDLNDLIRRKEKLEKASEIANKADLKATKPKKKKPGKQNKRMTK